MLTSNGPNTNSLNFPITFNAFNINSMHLRDCKTIVLCVEHVCFPRTFGIILFPNFLELLWYISQQEKDFYDPSNVLFKQNYTAIVHPVKFVLLDIKISVK